MRNNTLVAPVYSENFTVCTSMKNMHHSYLPRAVPSLLLTLTPSGIAIVGTLPCLSVNGLTDISNTPADSDTEYIVSSKPIVKSEYEEPSWNNEVYPHNTRELTIIINDENGKK